MKYVDAIGVLLDSITFILIADRLDSDTDELDLRVLDSIAADTSERLMPSTLGASSSDSACIIGTVQSSSLIIDGRPVMTVSMLSKALIEYQIRARVVRSRGESELLASRKCRPSDWAARIARPFRFQALMITISGIHAS